MPAFPSHKRVWVPGGGSCQISSCVTCSISAGLPCIAEVSLCGYGRPSQNLYRLRGNPDIFVDHKVRARLTYGLVILGSSNEKRKCGQGYRVRMMRFPMLACALRTGQTIFATGWCRLLVQVCLVSLS